MEGGKRPRILDMGRLIMEQSYKHVVLFVLVGAIAGLGITASQTDSSFAQTAAKPNILFIIADDMKASDLEHMPNTQTLLANRGVKFTKAWVTRSLCCPSRATVLTGQYTHNHNVWVNVELSGGFPKFVNQGLESSTIATWLQAGGYETVLIGKCLNRYGNKSPTPHIPSAGISGMPGRACTLAPTPPTR
jgi:N-acetylglucosamine-6-sulfatase